MATYYPGSSNEREAAATPMVYLPGAYSETPVLTGNMMMYMNPGSYSDGLPSNAQQQNNCIEIQSVEGSTSTHQQQQQQEILTNLEGSRVSEHDINAWRDGRNEMLVMHSIAGTSSNIRGHQDAGNKGDYAQYGMTSIARTIPNSKYLKAAQQLLDEVVNVRKALRHADKDKSQKTNENEMNNSSNSASELSHSERQELQNKLTKLLSMLDEVDRRYKQYYHQMQIVVSSFDVIAGCGAAKPYTALALQTISRHFRCLRDAINGQIKTVRKSLGEQETSENSKGVAITRLRYVDQQLRQQRALQQLGMMQQHSWRPQRGLPENSVSILRAWLFEHFLHPYPKDSDKIMLARQTGLTRGQVSNWFINARVRLWKPMVEEMYKEELGDAEMDSNSSSETAAARALSRADMRSSEDQGEEMQQQHQSVTSSSATEQAMEKTSDHHHHVQDMDMVGSSTLRPHFQFGATHGRLDVDDCGLYNEAIGGGGGDNRFMAAAAAAYQMQEMGRYGSGSSGGVSLTLGLQHCEGGGGGLPISGASHHHQNQGFVSMRGDDIYSAAAAASSVGGETREFECVNPGSRQQHRFNSSHLLHDFVA
ncbi:unnamed protein product [Linum tenue]|uniref:Homeobox domain-containing protein n=1 Tax=Linum tenue TaxID=586396 RepID=A0AAV0LUW3_9ROSI|nr:unnamed protein product [Linum tenue]